MIFSLVRNELQKTWRSRWIVFAVMAGIFVLISGGLYIYYVVSKNQWSPPPAVSWQVTTQQDLTGNQSQLDSLEQIKQQSSDSTGPSKGFGPGTGIDSAIAQVQQQINDDKYLLDHNIAPVQSFSITLAALF